MMKGKEHGTVWARLRAAQRRWCPRWRRPAALVLVALCLLFAEPLACIVHCQLYLPWLLGNQSAHQHHHVGHVQAAPETGTAAAIAWPGSPALGATTCFRPVGGHDSSPSPAVPPSPIHDIVPVGALALVGALCLRRRRPRAALQPRGIAAPPPAPPPKANLLLDGFC